MKTSYRKATMLCHPDKVRSSPDNPDKVYIANMCFAALTEAYNIFKVRNWVVYFVRKKKGFNENGKVWMIISTKVNSLFILNSKKKKEI